MKRPVPYRCVWTGEVFRPADDRALAAINRDLGAGEIVTLERNEERSMSSHSHYFAALNEAFRQLREEDAKRFTNVEHLRKWALIQAGYYNERHMVCSSEQDAKAVAAFIEPSEQYAVIEVRNKVVRVYTAKSQSTRDMNKRHFQDSKDKVLQIVSDMIGVSPEDLKRNAGKAA